MWFDTINRMQRINPLIRQKSTGTPQEFAAKFDISTRQLYNILEELKDMGADIKYSRKHETFYYNDDFEINILFKVSILSSGEEKTIFAGKNVKSEILLHGRELPL